jgi:hypothetical protein
MNRLIVLLLCCYAVLAPARAQAPVFNDKTVGHWMTHYYVDKDVGQVGAFVHWIAAYDFVKNPSFRTPASGFLAAVFMDNPGLVRGWVSDAQPNAEAKSVIERALWFSGRADLISQVFHDTPPSAPAKPFPLMELTLNTPASWEVMWTAFSATGDTAYPARLIDLLDDRIAFTHDAQVDAAYHQDIARSLEANMAQHELILRMVRQQAQQRTGVVQQKLQAMITRVEAQRLVTNDCDGEFCGLLALINANDLKELDKPSDETPAFHEMHFVKPGANVAVTLAFTGMSLADDLSADVSYDIKIVRPDGALYADGEHKDLTALKSKVAQRFRLYDNRSGLLTISFEPTDPRGLYQVEAVLKDNIGGKTVTLRKGITLID